MERLERGKKKPATTLIFPYRTRRSHIWILFVVTVRSTTKKLSVYIPATAGWQNDDAYKTASVRLREAYDFSSIDKERLDYTKSEDVLYFTTIVAINDKIDESRTPIERVEKIIA